MNVNCRHFRQCWHLNHFPLSAISPIQNSIKDALRSVFDRSLLHAQKKTFQRFTTICWHTCRSRNPNEANHTDSSHFIFVYIFFLSLRDLVRFLLLWFVFISNWVSWMCVPTQQHAKFESSFEEHKSLVMRRFVSLCLLAWAIDSE